MTDELVLYTNPMSRGRTARWMLEEVGQPYRVELLEYGPAMKAPSFLALNPLGKVPTLTHGGTVVTEAAAICAYLADAFPEAGLAPAPGGRARAAYYRWLFFAAGPIEAAFVDRALGVVVPADRRGMTGYGSLEDALDALERAVGAGDHLAGDRLHCGRPVRRVADRLRDDVRDDRRPAGAGRLCRADGRAPGGPARRRDRRRADGRPSGQGLTGGGSGYWNG